MVKNDAQQGYNDREKGIPLAKNASEEYKNGWYTCHQEFAGGVGNDPLHPMVIVEFIHTEDKSS